MVIDIQTTAMLTTQTVDRRQGSRAVDARVRNVISCSHSSPCRSFAFGGIEECLGGMGTRLSPPVLAQV